MLAQLAQLSPGIVAHRIAQTWPTGQAPSAAQQRELQRMVSEKVQAFGDGWWAVGLHMTLAWQAAWWQMATAPLAPTRWPTSTQLLGVALEPAHRVAVANSKRLSRRR